MRYAVSSAMCWSVYTLLWTNVTAAILSVVLVTGETTCKAVTLDITTGLHTGM